jgi:hypothetical protein
MAAEGNPGSPSIESVYNISPEKHVFVFMPG